MFTIVRYFVKTSFAFFILGMVSGIYIYGSRLYGWTVTPGLVQAHVHVLLMGGMVMMILGVAVWFFPRPAKEDKRYNPDVVKAGYWLLTLATLGRFVVEIFPSNNARDLGFYASVLQLSAVILIIYSIWGRIRPVGSQIREKRGEKF